MAKKAKPEKTIQCGLRLPASLHAAISRLAASKRLSVNQAVVAAVDEYIQREGRK
jgi:predicted HicB family RNase H-like nuclease